MSQKEYKHVQTELSEDDYREFRQFARERGLTVKEAGREALVSWIERQRQPDPDDPAFTVLEELDEGSLSETAETDASREDDLVEEWNGEDVVFTLAREPSSGR